MTDGLYPPDEQRMLDLIEYLAGNVGPRPAGSAAENAAQDDLAALLREWGYRVELRPAPFAPLPAFLPYYSFPAVLFLLGAALLPVFPWLALALPVVPPALPAFANELTRRLPRTGTSRNLFAAPPDCDWQDLDLVISAHVDTARANPVHSGFLRTTQDSIFPSMRRIAWILAFLGAISASGRLTITGFVFPPVLQYAALLGAGLLAVSLIGFDLAEQLLGRDVYVPGAYDNASGVAVLMAAAEQYSAAEKYSAAEIHAAQETGEDGSDVAPSREKPVEQHRIKVGFLITGAEETGLHGAEAAAAWLKERNAVPRVLVLDQVGAGSHLRWIRKLGQFFPIHTNSNLNELLLRANPALEPLDHFTRSGDYEAFLRAGFPSAGLESSGSKDADWAYHTVHDTPAVIEMHMLAECLDTLDRLIWIMEKDKK
jgi:hypothetical protein